MMIRDMHGLEDLKTSPYDGIGFGQARSDMAETAMHYDLRISTPMRDVEGTHAPRCRVNLAMRPPFCLGEPVSVRASTYRLVMAAEIPGFQGELTTYS